MWSVRHGHLGVVEFFTSPDLWVAFLTLFVLEVVLGVDNVVFISILAGKLPPEQQRKARLLGLSLAMFLRIRLLFLASWIVGLTPLFGIGSAEALQFSGRDRKTVNVIADSPKGKHEDETIIVGAYRDPVLAGPGIIDNGSGSSRSWRLPRRWPSSGTPRSCGGRCASPSGARRSSTCWARSITCRS